METISIVNVGNSNVGSITNLLNKLGVDSKVACSPEHLRTASKIILPGVGSFDSGVVSLKISGYYDLLKNYILSSKVPTLGICLGMQLLCNRSEEGEELGLGLIDAEVVKFKFPAAKGLKVPHMGWNIVRTDRPNSLLPEGLAEQRFYFVHSYKVVPKDPAITIGTAYYGDKFCAAFQKENIFGVQFHPEKSHRFGLALIKRFVEL